MFEIPSKWKNTLRYFDWKVRKNISDLAYEEVRTLLNDNGVNISSLHVTRRFLEAHLGIHIQEFHRCVDNCMAFTGEDLLRRRCRFLKCNSKRFSDADSDQEFYPSPASYEMFKPRAVYRYIPIIPRLKLFFSHPEISQRMRYPRTLINNPWEGVRDVWDGSTMKRWIEEGTSSCYKVMT